MRIHLSRREFVAISMSGICLGRRPRSVAAEQDQRRFELSLNERSLHRALTKKQVDHLNFAAIAKNEFGIEAVEYVSSYFSAHISDDSYIKRMNQSAAEHGVRQILIVVDDAGALADPDSVKRKAAVTQHLPWIELAKALGCQSICVDVAGEGPESDRVERAVESLNTLAEAADRSKIHILVTTSGRSSWTVASLLALFQVTDPPRIGVAASFTGLKEADRYAAMEQLIPFAKAVHATAEEFDAEGHETAVDYFRMMQVVLDAGYRGHVGIKFQGKKMDEFAGIRATKSLLEQVKGQ